MNYAHIGAAGFKLCCPPQLVVDYSVLLACSACSLLITLLCCELILPYSEGESLPKIQTELALPWLGGSQLCPVCITALAQVVWTFALSWWLALPCLTCHLISLHWHKLSGHLALFGGSQLCLALPCLALPCLALPCLGDQC